MTTAPELVFVHIGESVPTYVRSALSLADRDARLPLRMLCSSATAPHFTGLYATTAIDDFYDPTPFLDARRNIAADHTFRDGFWLKTTERYFVLAQYMDAHRVDRLVHAELDSLTFALDRFVSNLDRSGERGIFLPFDHPARSIASLVYVNDPAALHELVRFITTTTPVRNDMDLLARFAQHSPRSVRRLPTLESLTRPAAFEELACRAITPSQLGGIVDAASIGQWIGGIDPRNRGFGPHWNHFENDVTTRNALASLDIVLDASGPTARIGDLEGVRLYNLHLHSKMHEHLTRRSQLRRLVRWSRRRRRSILRWDVRRNAKMVIQATKRQIRRTQRVRAAFPRMEGD